MMTTGCQRIWLESMTKKQPKGAATSTVTQWFQDETKPTRPGIYERDIKGIGVRFAHWNGRFWGGFATDVDSAYRNRFMETAHHFYPWRGLAKKPAANQHTTTWEST